MLKRLIRETIFQISRHDLARFLEDHEARLLEIFREEMHILDEAMPEENMYIDIRMVPLGEAILKSALKAIRRFLTEDIQ
jgi:hypothetical protein